MKKDLLKDYILDINPCQECVYEGSCNDKVRNICVTVLEPKECFDIEIPEHIIEKFTQE